MVCVPIKLNASVQESKNNLNSTLYGIIEVANKIDGEYTDMDIQLLEKASQEISIGIAKHIMESIE